MTITLPVPTPFAIDPARLTAWLAGQGWSPCERLSSDRWIVYERRSSAVRIPRNPQTGSWNLDMSDSVTSIAAEHHMAPHTLAALIGPPAPGPALQWAHMADTARAPVLALLDGRAAEHRAGAVIARLRGDGESALAHEGRAMGLEAAAAVLRGAR